MTAIMEPADKARDAADANAFDRHFLEVYFATHAFGGERQLDEVEATYKGEKVEDDLVSGSRALLVPRELAKTVDQARGKIYRLLKAYCLSGSIRGSYYVATSRSEEFIAKFNELRDEFDAAADEAAASFDRIVAHNRERWLPKMGGDEREFERTIGRHLPRSAEALRGHYRVDFRPLRGAEAAKGAGKGAAIRSFFAEAHRNAVAHEEAERQARYKEPIERLSAAVSGLWAQLERGKVISPKTFTKVEESLALFGVCVDIMAPELVAVVDQLAASLANLKAEAQGAAKGGVAFTRAAKDRAAAVKKVVDDALAACSRAVEDDEVEARVGRRRRGFSLANEG